MIDQNTLAAARQYGRHIAAMKPEAVTDKVRTDQVSFACELHMSDDPTVVRQIGEWLAKEITAIRADGEGGFLKDLAEEIRATIREMSIAQAIADKPKDLN